MTRWESDPLGIMQKIQFNHTNKCYIHNMESLLENETHKVLWDFEIQTDHLISARPPDLVIAKKREPAEEYTLPSWQTSE